MSSFYRSPILSTSYVILEFPLLQVLSSFGASSLFCSICYPSLGHLQSFLCSVLSKLSKHQFLHVARPRVHLASIVPQMSHIHCQSPLSHQVKPNQLGFTKSTITTRSHRVTNFMCNLLGPNKLDGYLLVAQIHLTQQQKCTKINDYLGHDCTNR